MKRLAFIVLILLAGCASLLPTSPAEHPNEVHILAETQRFAARLGISVMAVITTEPYMVPASAPLYPGEKVPAAGRYVHGRIEYYRPVIQERSQEWGSWLAAHEVAHAFYRDGKGGVVVEERADFCALHLMSGKTCER